MANEPVRGFLHVCQQIINAAGRLPAADAREARDKAAEVLTALDTAHLAKGRPYPKPVPMPEMPVPEPPQAVQAPPLTSPSRRSLR